MKTTFIPWLMGLALSCASAYAQKATDKEHIRKEFTLSKGAEASVLAIHNVDGAIQVEGYSGSQVLIEVDKTLSADNNQVLEEGKKAFRLQFDQNADSLIVYIAQPFDSRPNRNWKNDNDNRIDCRYELNFTVKVPYAMSLNLSTINGGTVTVKDVSGSVKANNINGGITLTNLKGTTQVRTINGDVTVNYLSTPPEQSSYYTLNGNIRVTFPASLSADLQFKSFRGELFTDFANVELLPPHVTKTTEKHDEGTVYKLSRDTAVRIGKGGKLFKFETFNGNVYIKKQA